MKFRIRKKYTLAHMHGLKVRKGATIRNQYNQVSHLTHDSTWESVKSTIKLYLCCRYLQTAAMFPDLCCPMSGMKTSEPYHSDSHIALPCSGEISETVESNPRSQLQGRKSYTQKRICLYTWTKYMGRFCLNSDRFLMLYYACKTCA